MNAWFRFYHEWDSDPKVQIMPENMQRRLAMLFCWRCKGETFHVTEAAFHWRVSETDMEETRQLFMRQGFIDDKWNLLNWNKRQFVSDSSTDRVRRHREAKKQDETLHKTKRNVTETGSSVSVSVSEYDSGSETIISVESNAAALMEDCPESVARWKDLRGVCAERFKCRCGTFSERENNGLRPSKRQFKIASR